MYFDILQDKLISDLVMGCLGCSISTLIDREIVELIKEASVFLGIPGFNKKRELHNSNISVILKLWTACVVLSGELALQKN